VDLSSNESWALLGQLLEIVIFSNVPIPKQFFQPTLKPFANMSDKPSEELNVQSQEDRSEAARRLRQGDSEV